MQVFRLAGVDVARDVQVVVVGRVGDRGQRNHARIARQLGPAVERVHDAVDVVLGAQAVLVAVLAEALARVDHEDALAGVGVFLVDDQDAGRDAGAVKKVGGQADNALDEAALDEILANIGLPVAAEQHPVGQDDRALALALERGDEVQQESVVAVFGRGNAVGEAPKAVVGRVEAVGPCLVGEGRIGDGEIEGLEAAVRVREVGGGQRVAVLQFGGFVAVQDHVHPRQRPGGVVFLLTVHGDAARRPVGGLEQQRAGTAGRIVNRLPPARVGADADHLGHDARDLGRGVELPLALARLGGEVPHQVLVGVAQQIVALGPVGLEVEAVEYGDQLGEPVLHLLARAEPALVVEIGLFEHALETVGLGELADDLVDFVADLLVALQLRHVGEAAAGGHFDRRVGIAGVLVRDVLHEQQGQHVVLVLRGVHAAAQLVAALPERRIKLGFLQGHRRRPLRSAGNQLLYAAIGIAATCNGRAGNRCRFRNGAEYTGSLQWRRGRRRAAWRSRRAIHSMRPPSGCSTR